MTVWALWQLDRFHISFLIVRMYYIIYGRMPGPTARYKHAVATDNIQSMAMPECHPLAAGID